MKWFLPDGLFCKKKIREFMKMSRNNSTNSNININEMPRNKDRALNIIIVDMDCRELQLEVSQTLTPSTSSLISQ